MACRNSLAVALLAFLYIQTICADLIDVPPKREPFTYEVIGSNSESISSAENGIEGNYYRHVGIIHSRRQRRSPHLGLGGHPGHGVAYRPVYVQHQTYPVQVHPPHHYYGGGHGLGVQQVNSNSQAQAQAVSANFGGPSWNAGFSGAAASSGGGVSQLNNLGYHGK